MESLKQSSQILVTVLPLTQSTS